MKTITTLIAVALLVPSMTFASTTLTPTQISIITQLIAVLEQELATLEAQPMTDTTSTTSTTTQPTQTVQTPQTFGAISPTDQSGIIAHDDTAFYSKDPTHKVYSVFVLDTNGAPTQNPDQSITFTVDGQTDLTQMLNSKVLWDTRTAMTNPDSVGGVLFHVPAGATSFTVSSGNLTQTITL